MNLYRGPVQKLVKSRIFDLLFLFTLQYSTSRWQIHIQYFYVRAVLRILWEQKRMEVQLLLGQALSVAPASGRDGQCTEQSSAPAFVSSGGEKVTPRLGIPGKAQNVDIKGQV